MMAPASTTASAISTPTLREARFQDYDAIAALELANGLKSRGREEWTRFWTENPVYRSLGSAFPIGWVLEDQKSGRLVGTLSNVPLSYAFNGRDLVAATGRGWAVDADYRAFAPLLLDEYFHQDAGLLLSTTVNGLAEASHMICEQTKVPVGNWSRASYRIVDYPGFAKAAAKLKKMPGAFGPFAAAALWARDLAKAPRLPEAPARVEVAAGFEFGPGFDGFWADLRKAKNGVLLGFRSREILAWHFGLQLKCQRARVLAVERRNRIEAYAVLVRSDHAASGLKRLRLADFQTLSNDPGDTAALIRKAVDVCREDGAHVLEVVGSNLPALRDWEEIAPYKRSLPAWCYFFHSNDAALLESLHDPAVWEPSTFDGDSSI